MLKRTLFATLLAISPLTATADPVVVELYTSQGCSSCPPADDLLADLAQNDQVLALSLHVDYWDYIGWTDKLADPAHARRQRAYAAQHGDKMVYTPQMIIGGTHSVVGSHPSEVARSLRAAHRPAEVEITVSDRGNSSRVLIRRPMDAKPLEVTVVRYTPEVTTPISRGENAGRTLTSINVVTEWRLVKRWNGMDDLTIDVPKSSTASAIIVQEAGPGAIIGCSRVN